MLGLSLTRCPISHELFIKEFLRVPLNLSLYVYSQGSVSPVSYMKKSYGSSTWIRTHGPIIRAKRRLNEYFLFSEPMVLWVRLGGREQGRRHLHRHQVRLLIWLKGLKVRNRVYSFRSSGGVVKSFRAPFCGNVTPCCKYFLMSWKKLAELTCKLATWYI